MKNVFYKIVVGFFMLFILIIGSSVVFFYHPKFGKYPQHNHITQFNISPNFHEGTFHYPVPTALLVDDESPFSIILNDFFAKKIQTKLISETPTIKTNLYALDINSNVIIWLGHSSYFIQLSGQRILIDPIFSEYASPLSFINRAFNHTSIYKAEDMPEIDLLLITHDHWDHLDYPSVIQLMAKTQRVITPLGVGSHFKYWGYASEKIHEADWFTALEINSELAIHVLPARHYSGRLFEQNKTLWAGFALQTPQHSIFLSGDSGYGPHFKEIADRLGAFDFVLLDSGQYDPRWPSIHMTPEEAVQASHDLQANVLIPAHVGRFSIAQHAWNDPFIRLAQASKNLSVELYTPIIGQPVWLDEPKPEFSYWWQGLN